MERVIVTGASGFVGRQVIKCLVNGDYEVHCLTTRDINDARRINHRVQWHNVDLNNFNEIEDVFRCVNPSILVHLAWNVKDRSYKNSEDNLNWIGITLKVLMEFHKCGGRRAVFAGTCFEYDLKQSNLEEDTAVLSGINLYGVCKASLSRIVKKFCEDRRISYVWGRIFYCFGPNESSNRIVPHVINSLIKNERVTISGNNQYLDYLPVEEVGRAFYEILISGVTGEVNIGAGKGVNLKEMLALIGKIMDKEDLIEFSDEIRAEYPVVIANNRKLVEETNWRYKVNLEDKLKKNIEWWKEQRKNER